MGIGGSGLHYKDGANVPRHSTSVNKSEEEWRVQLSPQQFKVLRGKGTEMPGTGEFDKKVGQS